jgi:CheY-like chemotaxis protein
MNGALTNGVVFNQGEAPETVLVVDDYDDARASMRDILEDLGQHVTEAANGRDALHFLIFHREVKVKLIILDLQMPTMNGWEFLTLLRSYVRLALIPVVIASAHASSLPSPNTPPVLGCLKLPYQPKELSAVLQIVNNNAEQS